MLDNKREALAIILAPLVLPTVIVLFMLIADFSQTLHWLRSEIANLAEGRYQFGGLSVVLAIAYVGNTIVALPAYIHYRDMNQATLPVCGWIGFLGGILFATPVLLYWPPGFLYTGAITGICGAVVATTFCLIAGPSSPAESN